LCRIVFPGVKIAQIVVMKRHVNTNQFGTFSDFMPVCARCKIMRNNEGYWVQVTGASHPKYAEMEFAYCICAKCAKKLFPEEFDHPV